jgi:hypothetical protein
MAPRNLHTTTLALLSGALLACAPLPGQGDPQASEHGVHAQPKKPARPSPSPSVEVVPTALLTIHLNGTRRGSGMSTVSSRTSTLTTS